MDLINMYIELIITPLEEEMKNLRKKVYSRNFSFTRKTEKEYLEKIENELFQYYEKFASFINEEREFKYNLQKRKEREFMIEKNGYKE